MEKLPAVGFVFSKDRASLVIIKRRFTSTSGKECVSVLWHGDQIGDHVAGGTYTLDQAKVVPLSGMQVAAKRCDICHDPKLADGSCAHPWCEGWAAAKDAVANIGRTPQHANYTTKDELARIRTMETMRDRGAARARLSNYLKAARTRDRWGHIDKSEVMEAAERALRHLDALDRAEERRKRA